MTIKSDSALPGVSYVEWSSVIAGTVLALALSLILIQFSSLVGLSVFVPTQPGEKTRWMVITAAIWLFWVQLMASMAGGYMSGRMRGPVFNSTETETEVRDGAHGILVWATATLVAVVAVTLASALTALTTSNPTPAVQHHADIAEHLTKNAGIIFGFAAAAGSLVSAAAAAWTAKIGGEHRDKNLRFTVFARR